MFKVSRKKDAQVFKRELREVEVAISMVLLNAFTANSRMDITA